MGVYTKIKPNQSVSAALYEFNKRVRQSGVLREVKKRRFRDRPQNKRRTRLAALHREAKHAEITRLKKLGKSYF